MHILSFISCSLILFLVKYFILSFKQLQWSQFLDMCPFSPSFIHSTSHWSTSRSSQKCNHCNQYYLGIYFQETLQGTFVFNINVWSAPSYMIDFTCFPTDTIYLVLNSLVSLTLFHIYLCLSLLSDTRMLNNSTWQNRRDDAASN